MLPPGLALYRIGTHALSPLAGPVLKSRAGKGKEDPARLAERRGRASATRPPGPLVWLHGASVGESLMLLALLEAIREERPDLRFLVTTGTVTSAELMEKRLPDCATHQYAPLDALPWVRAFLDHWRPDLGVFAESELWPNLLLEAKARGARLALVNARMTDGSVARWRRWSPASAKKLISAFDWIGAADQATATALSDLAGHPVALVGNLKSAGDPPSADPTTLAEQQRLIGERPIWLAASTHEGEERIVLEAHGKLREERPNALLIVAPRHPDRGPAVAELARRAGFSVRRRAAGESPHGQVAVYVADTLGEMGLWLRLAQTVFVGGSLVEGVGGHNPLEPIALDAPVIAGPHTFNFAAMYDGLVAAGGAARVRSAAEIAREIRLLEGPLRTARIEAAKAATSDGARIRQAVMEGLRPLLPGRSHG